MPIAGIRHLVVIGMLQQSSNMASWHPARNVINFFHVIESNQLPLVLAACQLAIEIL